MKTFTYPVFFRFLYKFGNIPVTILLVLYLIPAVLAVDRNLFFLIPIILFLFLIYYLNKKYLSLYKIIPYKITADDEKMNCTNFLFSEKETIIYYKDITSLKGGIFDGRLSGLMKVYDGRNKTEIGIFSKIRNVKDLQTIILSKVTKAIYNEVVERIALKSRTGSSTSKETDKKSSEKNPKS